MIKYGSTLVMIPTLNEEEAIGDTIDDVNAHVDSCQIVVVDGYSDDRTKDIALDKGALVIDAPRGKGLAVRTVLPVILGQFAFRWLVMLDGDFTYPAKYIPLLVRSMEHGADVVMGYRRYLEKGSMTTVNRIGNCGLSILASLLYWTPVNDLCTGLWGIHKPALRMMSLTSDRFTLEADLFVNTVRNGFVLDQIPIEYRARQQGSNTKLMVKDGLEIGWFLVKGRFGKGDSVIEHKH